MRKRKSFLRRHIVAVTFFVLVAVYSVTATWTKQDKLNELRAKSEAAIEQIQQLEMELKDQEYQQDKMDDPDFVERFVREKLKMVRPNEVHFEMMYGDNH